MNIDFKIKAIACTLLFILLPPTASAIDVDTCLREYETRYNTDSEAGETLPPMRNLYPDWEEDCKNGGSINEEVKGGISQEEVTEQDVALPPGFQGKWILQKEPGLSAIAGMTPIDWITITSTTDDKVHIQKVIVNKGRCSPLIYPKHLLEPNTVVDYGQYFKVTGNRCGPILELTVVTDMGSITINP